MMIQPPTLNAIRVARVCHVHPEGHSFDGIFCDTGDYCRNVQVLSPMAGTDFGFSSGIPAPEEEGWEENREINPDRRDVLAVVTTCSAGLLCLGFLYPQVNHLAFTKDLDKNRLVERHTSDFYRTISDLANMDMVHPSMAYIRMGMGLAPEILEGRDYDKRWARKRNVGVPAAISIAAPLGVFLAGGSDAVVIGDPEASPPVIDSPEEDALPAVDWIADALLTDVSPPCEDKNENGICDELEELKKRYNVLIACTGGGFEMTTENVNKFAAYTGDPDKPAYWFHTILSNLSIHEKHVDIYVGKSSGLSVREDSIVMQVGNTKLEITAEGIKTTGNIMTEGVHTDNNGTHV